MMHLCSPGAGHQSLTQQSLYNQCLRVEPRHRPERAGPQGGRHGCSGAFTGAIISAPAVFALHSLSHLYQLGGKKQRLCPFSSWWKQEKQMKIPEENSKQRNDYDNRAAFKRGRRGSLCKFSPRYHRVLLCEMDDNVGWCCVGG